MATTKQTPKKPETVTLRLERVIKAPPERVYKAFLDPDALAKWMPPHGFTGHVHEIDARVGGTYRMSFSTINRSWTQFFGGKFVELKPYEKIVHVDRFETDDPSQKSEMTVTITFAKIASGTKVNITQEGIPKGPSADGAPEGWKQSLDNLQRLCEAELPF